MDEIKSSSESKPKRSRPKTNWLKAILCGCIVAMAVFFLDLYLWYSSIRNSPYRGDRTEAVNNAKQIGLALFEFDVEYETFPSESTVIAINRDAKSRKYPNRGFDLSGSSSNAIFRQLFVIGITENEKMFYAKAKGSKRPDNHISDGNLLAKGEVGFSYVSGLSSNDDPNTPILITPLIPGTTKFDQNALYGEAVVLRIDQSVKTYKIQKDGHIYEDGIDILSSAHPVWKGKTPDIRYPDL